MADFWDRYGKPIPILQWLVVIVLSAHVLVSSGSSLTPGQAEAFVLALVGGNLALLFGLPRIISWGAISAILVIVDSLLVPTALFLIGVNDNCPHVVYFGIIMIAGGSGKLKP